MSLDPQVKAFLDRRAAKQPPPPAISDLPLEEARAGFSGLWKKLNPPSRALNRIAELVVPGPRGPIKCRLYKPRATDAAVPVLVWYHGGGCVLLSAEDYDGTSTALAAEADCMVIAPDFRRAPEHPFPAPLEDSYAVYEWLILNAGAIGGDPARIALAGDSGGGYLAAAVPLEAKRLGRRQPLYQVLIYPMIDPAGKTSSRVTEALFIDDAGLDWTNRLHFGEHLLDPRAALLRAADHRGLAPALVIGAEHDPLRDEGRAYALKLRQAGVPALWFCYEGMIHGFFSMGAIIDAGNLAVQQVAGALRHVFRRAT